MRMIMQHTQWDAMTIVEWKFIAELHSLAYDQLFPKAINRNNFIFSLTSFFSAAKIFFELFSVSLERKQEKTDIGRERIYTLNCFHIFSLSRVTHNKFVCKQIIITYVLTECANTGRKKYERKC